MDREYSSETGDFYPQMLQSIFICHPPAFMLIFVRMILKRFVSKETLKVLD